MKIKLIFISLASLLICGNAPLPAPAADLPTLPITELSGQLSVGDVVFVRIDLLPFRKIAEDTKSWTNHVGIIVGEAQGEYQVAESTFPYSAITPLSKFVGRSERQRFAIYRLTTPITEQQRSAIIASANKRLGIFYDTGFNLTSSGQFCSRYVSEVIYEATGLSVGKVETLSTLLEGNPDADIAFWRAWYLGFIPWDRKTITPASMINSPLLQRLYDGYMKSSDD